MDNVKRFIWSWLTDDSFDAEKELASDKFTPEERVSLRAMMDPKRRNTMSKYWDLSLWSKQQEMTRT